MSLVATGPVLKGELPDPVWQQAARLTGFVALDEGAPPEATTEVYALGDSEALYVASVCLEPNMDQLVSETSGHGGPVPGDDCVRVVVDPARGGVWAWHWAANSIGAVWNAPETPVCLPETPSARESGAFPGAQIRFGTHGVLSARAGNCDPNAAERAEPES